jgi:hypothetical protein
MSPRYFFSVSTTTENIKIITYTFLSIYKLKSHSLLSYCFKQIISLFKVLQKQRLKIITLVFNYIRRDLSSIHGNKVKFHYEPHLYAVLYP